MKYGPNSNKKVAPRFEVYWQAWSSWIIPAGSDMEVCFYLVHCSYHQYRTGAWEFQLCVLGFWFAIGRYEK